MPSKRTARLAKLTQPRFHAPLKRTRLFKLLDEGKRPVVWISGPAGSGKTTLAASYLETRKARAFWFQVDEGDRDSASFFYYLGQLAEETAGKQRTSLPRLEAEYLANLAQFTREFFRALFKRLGTESVLVLDNCHDAASETFHLILREACAEIPDSCRLIALSRATAPAELSRQAASKRLQEIAWPQLRLSDAEAHAIAAGSASQAALQQAVALNRRCDGWVGGLVLLLSRGAQGDEATREFESRQAVFDYFAEEVFMRAGRDTQTLLLTTALLPYTTVSMASAMSSLGNADDILNTLYRNQYFVERRVEDELTYQYHDLFREFLLARAQRIYAPEELAELRRRAARILEQAQRLPEAAELYKQSRDWDALARLIRGNAEQLLDQGRWQTLQAWFNESDGHLPADDATLLVWRGLSYVASDPARARDLLERAYARLDPVDNANAFARATLALVDFAFVFGDQDPLKRLSAALEPLLSRPGSLAGAVKQQVCKAYLDAAISIGSRNALVETTLAALETQLRQEQLSIDLQIGIYEELQLYGVFAADERLGALACEALERLARREDVSPFRCYWGITILGFWYYFRLDADHGLHCFTVGVELADRWRMGTQSTLARVYRGLALYRMGDSAAAQRELSDLINHHEPVGPMGAGYLAWAAAALAEARGEMAEAAAHAEAMTRAMRSGSFGLVEAIGWSLRASYALRLDRREQALDAVRQARQLIEASVYRRYDALLLSIEAEVAWRNGDIARTQARLHEMLPLTRNRVVAACLVELAPWLNRQLAYGLAQDIEAPAARALIAEFDLAPNDIADANWPWPVKVSTLGVFVVEVGGKLISFSGKAPKKALALLQAIIALGGQSVPETEVIDALWPDSEGDTGREAMKITLLRLRKLLGTGGTIEWQQGKLSLNAQRVWVDAFAFETAAEQALREAEPEQVESALRLYAGNFLPDGEQQAWPVLTRERLARKFVHLVAQHGRSLEQRSDFAAAEKTYLRGLDADPLAEAFYQGLMRCYLAGGQHADGMNVYRRLHQQLSVTLNIEPSKESQALHQALQRPGTAAARSS